MVSVRDASAFGVFRTDMSSALAAAADSVDGGEIASAQRIVAEHMDAGLSRLTAGSRRGVLREAAIPEVVGWTVGAAVAGSIAGLGGVAGALIGKVASRAAIRWPSQGKRSLRAHYIALGTRSLETDSSVDFSTVAISDFQSYSDVGNAFKYKRREARSDTVLASLEGLNQEEEN